MVFFQFADFKAELHRFTSCDTLFRAVFMPFPLKIAVEVFRENLWTNRKSGPEKLSQNRSAAIQFQKVNAGDGAVPPADLSAAGRYCRCKGKRRRRPGRGGFAQIPPPPPNFPKQFYSADRPSVRYATVPGKVRSSHLRQ